MAPADFKPTGPAMTQASPEIAPGRETGVSPLRSPGLAPTLSPIVAGAWRIAEWRWTVAERLAWIAACVDLGVTSFDHADIYGNYQAEALFGEALAAAPGLRDRIQLVSKTGIALRSSARPEHRIKHYRQGREHVVASAEASLRELCTDHLDLLLLHRPNPLLDADEVAEAFAALRQSGKVLAFGVSNHSPAQFELLHSRIALVTNQVELSPLQLAVLNDGTLDQAQRLALRPMVWSPLAGGRLFGDDAIALRVRAALSRIAQSRNTSLETVAYAWLLRHPSRPIPISGSRRIEALAAAVAALELRLDEQEWFEVLEAATGHEVA
jgi:predicted oxidoreductase